MKKIEVILCAVLGIVLLASDGFSQDLDGTLKKIKTSGVFSLGYRESAPPFSFPGPDRRPVGYSIDLCTHIASAIQKQLGINLKLNWQPVSADNRVDMVVQGKIDIECGTTTMTLGRQERVDFSLMTFVDGGGLLIRSESKFSSVADFADKRVAVMTGTTTEAALKKFFKEQFVIIKPVSVKSPLEGLAALDKGSVDAFASDRGILAGLAVTSKDPKRFAMPDLAFSYEPYGFMLRRNDAAFRLAVNRALASLYRTGGFVPIYERWFGGFGKPGPAIQAMFLLNGLPE